MTTAIDRSLFPELIPMRPDERIDPERVGRCLEGRLPHARGTPEVLQFEGGKANLTYLLRYADAEYVLRRPPLGPVAPRSHDMGRESRVLQVLWRAYPLAPRAYLFSEDESVVGAPFFVMERRQGIVIREEMPERFQGDPALFRRMSGMLVDALADLHNVDPEPLGLGDLGRPEGFVERQIAGWRKRWEAAKTAEVPAFYRLADWLMERVPRAQVHSLLHNDFKLDNMMVDAEDPARPVAVFDWDMCTLGDPFSDLGTLLSYWTEPADPEARKAFAVMPTHHPGWYTRQEVVDRYAARTGLDVSDIHFYEAFGLYKVCVIIQQIYVRYHRGQTRDTRFRDYGERALGLLRAAELVAEQAPG